MLQSLNYPEDYDMLSPQAQRAARERAAKEALAGHQIRWVGPLAAQTPPIRQCASLRVIFATWLGAEATPTHLVRISIDR